MKKITTVTFQNAYNYGATLQCYALQKKLIDMGYDVSVLNYNNPKIGNSYKPIFISNIRKSKKRFIKNIIKSLIHYKKRYKRAKSFRSFINNNINLTKLLNESEIKKNIIETDYYITGSDQVWNPNITKGFDDIYTLGFNCNSKKISYAASIGDANLVTEYSCNYKKIIENIDCISVRENDARVELEKISDKNINVTLDPTLLLQRATWDNLLTDEANELKEKYICAYVVQPDNEYVKIVNDLSKRTGLKVMHFGVKNPGYENVRESKYTEGPIDFIKTIKNAEYVVATSFHATVFSIIYHKNFYIVPHRETGSRVRNLLEKLEIKGRTFDSFKQFENVNFDSINTDWKKVDEKLESERTKSINWLKSALEGE